MSSHNHEPDGQNPYLTPLQREKLSPTSDQGLGPNPGRFLRDTIRDEKVEGLKQRFNDLFRDVKALSEAGFFSADRRPEYWERVETDRDTWQDWDWEPHLRELLETRDCILIDTYTGKEPTPQRFGQELGRCMRLICRDSLSEAKLLDIGFGFLKGLLFDSQLERYSSQSYSPAVLSTYIDELKDRAVQSYADELIELGLQSDLYQRGNEVARYLSKHNLRPSRYLLTELVQEVDYLPTDADMTGEDVTPPSGSPDDIDHYLSKLKDETDIQRIEDLMDRVDTCVYQLKNLSYIDLVDLFKRVYEESESRGTNLSRSDLSGSAQNQQVHHLRQFAGEKENSYMWRDSPIVTEENDEWVPTDFGKLVGLHLFTSEFDDVGWMHIHVLDNIHAELESEANNAIKNALEELDI